MGVSHEGKSLPLASLMLLPLLLLLLLLADLEYLGSGQVSRWGVAGVWGGGGLPVSVVLSVVKVQAP